MLVDMTGSGTQMAAGMIVLATASFPLPGSSFWGNVAHCRKNTDYRPSRMQKVVSRVVVGSLQRPTLFARTPGGLPHDILRCLLCAYDLCARHASRRERTKRRHIFPALDVVPCPRSLQMPERVGIIPSLRGQCMSMESGDAAQNR